QLLPTRTWRSTTTLRTWSVPPRASCRCTAWACCLLLLPSSDSPWLRPLGNRCGRCSTCSCSIDVHRLQCHHRHSILLNVYDLDAAALQNRMSTQFVQHPPEIHPKTPYGCTAYLKIHHESTLEARGIYVICWN
ncbi:hypothetical protein PMAYCL1PPCAC_25273, partial [Pristionchus mayeri]